jgi:hypothetical protein
MPKNANFDYGAAERARLLLEDFDVVGTSLYMALVPRGRMFEDFTSNVRAAIVTSTLGLSSVDYARRKYLPKTPRHREPNHMREAYTDAYMASKHYIARLLNRFTDEGRPDPTVGVFGAALVLERLKSSFFSAHFLYRLGHNYEGHAIARLILEQIAWAYSAYPSNDMKVIESIKTTRSVTALRKFAPEAGRLYSFRSNKTHIDYSSHMEFLQIEDGRGVVLHAQPAYKECAKVILTLSDLFGAVWEVTQADYLTSLETIAKPPNSKIYARKEDRPFRAIGDALLAKMTAIGAEKES